jgi:hypothetical protein
MQRTHSPKVRGDLPTSSGDAKPMWQADARSDDAAPVFSWLSLLHPDGAAARMEVRHGLEPDTPGPDDSVDLSVLAATSHQGVTSRWLSYELERLTRRLAADGVGYVVVPRRWRRTAAGIASRVGLSVGPWLLHIPPLPDTRVLVPVDRRALRSAFGALVPGHRWTRRLLPAVLAVRQEGALPSLLPSAGLVVRRPNARPTYEWLFRKLDDEHPRAVAPSGVAILVLSWQAPHVRAVLHGLREGDATPSLVAKVRSDGPQNEAADAEIAHLARFGPDAERAGAAIPRAFGARRLAGRHVLLESAVTGRPAADLLAQDARRLGEITARLTDWLARWHAFTRVDSTLHQPVARVMLAGLDQLAPLLPEASSYRAWLATRCAAVSGGRLPLTAAHNDLTMWNVLVGPGLLAVVDWEHATAEALPLSDAFYAVVDAVVACGAPDLRLAAVRACLPPHGAHADLATRRWRQLAQDLSLSREVVTLAFHACWIHHAANETAALAGRPGPRPFLDVVQWLARNPVDLDHLSSR